MPTHAPRRCGQDRGVARVAEARPKYAPRAITNFDDATAVACFSTSLVSPLTTQNRYPQHIHTLCHRAEEALRLSLACRRCGGWCRPRTSVSSCHAVGRRHRSEERPGNTTRRTPPHTMPRATSTLAARSHVTAYNNSVIGPISRKVQTHFSSLLPSLPPSLPPP